MKASALPPPTFHVVVDRTEADGRRVLGIPVAGACLSLRGARKARRRVRKHYPNAYVEMRQRRQAARS